MVVLQGRFNVILGSADTTGRPIQDAFAGATRFVEIKVDGGAPILPRQQFLSSPYAFKAFSATNADRATVATVATSVSDVNVAYRNAANTFTANQTVTGNITASGNVLVGTEGWMYFSASHMAEYFRGTLPLSERDLDAWRKILEHRRDWLAEAESEAR